MHAKSSTCVHSSEQTTLHLTHQGVPASLMNIHEQDSTRPRVYKPGSCVVPFGVGYGAIVEIYHKNGSTWEVLGGA